MGFSGASVIQAMPAIMSSASQLASQFQGSGDSSGAEDQLEAQARIKELDAMEVARRERQQAAKSAEELREDKQRRKSRARAMWGKSGVGMSGSAARVLDGMDSDAENKIQDVRNEADERAKYALSTGQAQAKNIRDRASQYGRSVDPFSVGQSLIGLGRSIFDT